MRIHEDFHEIRIGEDSPEMGIEEESPKVLIVRIGGV
jgi:hypothetical protein